MEAVAIISVVSSSAVAAAAIWSGVWQQGRTFRHDRGREDRAAGRVLLARAATVLHDAEYAIDDAVAALTSFGHGMFSEDHPERAKPYFGVEKVGRDIDRVRDEVRIFLGPDHPATQSFEQANANFLEAFRAMKAVRLEGRAEPGTPAAAEVAGFIRQQRQRAATARDGFKISQAHFVRRAHAAVGADLPVED